MKKIIQCPTQHTISISPLLTLLFCFQQLLAGHPLYSFQAQRTQKDLVHYQKHQFFYTAIIYITSTPLSWNIYCDTYLLLSEPLDHLRNETCRLHNPSKSEEDKVTLIHCGCIKHGTAQAFEASFPVARSLQDTVNKILILQPTLSPAPDSQYTWTYPDCTYYFEASSWVLSQLEV